jgi:low affinity Fe/Cu permease
MLNELFHRFAARVSKWTGSPWMFVAALSLIGIWILTGPIFNFSDTWQLVINTGTTIITFLMVFLIQNTQNREARVTQLKLDELLRAINRARTGLVTLEELSEEELDRLHEEFRQLGEKTGRNIEPIVRPDPSSSEAGMGQEKLARKRGAEPVSSRSR